MVLLFKAIWLNLPTVIFDYGAAQLLWLQGGIVSYLILGFSYMPWRTFAVGVLDILMTATLVFLFGFVTHFVDMGDSSSTSIGTAYSFFCMMPVGIGGSFGAYFLVRRFSPQVTDWKVAAKELCNVFLNAANVEKLEHILPALPDADIMMLDATKHLLMVELGHTRDGLGRSSGSHIITNSLLRMTMRSRLKADGEHIDDPGPILTHDNTRVSSSDTISEMKVVKEAEKETNGDNIQEAHESIKKCETL